MIFTSYVYLLERLPQYNFMLQCHLDLIQPFLVLELITFAIRKSIVEMLSSDSQIGSHPVYTLEIRPV